MSKVNFNDKVENGGANADGKVSASDINQIKTSINSHYDDINNPHLVTKTQVGLSNVDNTSDVNKPVSTAQASADALKENTSNKSNDATADASSSIKFPTVKAMVDYFVANISGAAYLGSVVPTSSPSGSGTAYWTATQAGTYTNFGGVVVIANSFAIIGRNSGGTFSISQTQLDLSTKADLVAGGKNKFNYQDPTIIRGSFLGPTGILSSNSSYSVTGYIPISAGQSVVCNKAGLGGAYNIFYDANKNFISSFNTASSVAPASTAFVRYTLNVTAVADLLAAQVQVEIGGTSTSYESFKLSISTSQISNLNLNLKADLVVGKNKFNYQDADVLRGFYLNSIGGAVVNASFSVTGYIPVTPSQVIICNKNAGGGASNCFFDSNKVFISYFSTSSATAPAGAAFVRYSITVTSAADLLASQVQVELNSFSTVYESYFLGISPTQSALLSLNLKADLVSGKNKFNYQDPTVIRGSYLAVDGSVYSNPAYSITPYIPISAGQSVVCNKYSGAVNCFYDSTQTFLSSFTASSAVAPIGAAFVRFSILVATTDDISIAQVQVEFNVASTIYEAYRLVVPSTQLPASNYANRLALPLKQHFLSTIENNIYLTEFMKRDVESSFIRTTPAVGTRINDKIVALNPAAGTYAVSNQLVDIDYGVLQTKDYSIVVSDLSKTTPIKVLSIGDSYTDIGFYIKTMGQTIPAVTHVGTQKTSGGTDVNREGRSGWTLFAYATELGKGISPFYSPFLHPVAPYTYYGSTYFWSTTYAAAGTGYTTGYYPLIASLNLNSLGIRATPNTNDVQYFNSTSDFRYWNGSAWTVISEAALGFTINFAKYLSTYSIATPDVVTILLGMNDFRSLHPIDVPTTFVRWKSDMDTLIASTKAANPSVKFIIMACNSVEYNFLDGRGNAALWESYKLIIDNYDNREAEGIYISDTKASGDRVYGFGFTMAKPFALYSGAATILKTSGDVHYSADGMAMMGQKLAATIQYART